VLGFSFDATNHELQKRLWQKREHAGAALNAGALIACRSGCAWVGLCDLWATDTGKRMKFSSACGTKGMVSRLACSVGPKLSVADATMTCCFFIFWWVVHSVMADAAMIDVEITSSIGEEILKASVEEINSRCRSSSFASQRISPFMPE